jgi:acyl carrier protein
MNLTKVTRDSVADFVMTKVKELLQSCETITLDEELANHGMDSFASMSLVIEFETLYGITFEDEELLFENFATVRGMVERICLKLEIP